MIYNNLNYVMPNAISDMEKRDIMRVLEDPRDNFTSQVHVKIA